MLASSLLEFESDSPVVFLEIEDGKLLTGHSASPFTNFIKDH